MSRNSSNVCLLVLSYTALAVVFGWRMHATHQPQVVDDTLDATRTEIATRLAGAPSHLQKAALFQLALLPDEEVRSLGGWLESAAEDRLRKLTVQQGPVDAPCPLNAALVFAEFKRADAPPIDEMRHLISASGDRLEEPHKLAALLTLAGKATDNHEYSLALEIHQRVCESDAATWPDVLALAEAAQAARRPAAALKVVNIWLDPSNSKLNPPSRENALDLQSTLLLQGSRHAEASRISLDALRSLKLTAAVPERLLERALLATQAAGESAELLPWIERHLRTFPDHKMTVEDLAEGKAVAKEYRRWLAESALIADRSNHSSIACDDFFRLAAAGDLRVLARLHALATQIGRGGELAELLVSMQKRFSVLDLAAAFSDGDALAPARDLLTAHLKDSPKNRAGWRLLTQIDAKLRGAAAEPVLWEGFLKQFPDDVPALQHLARLQVRNSQLPQALRTLQQIPGDQLDETSLRQVAALAIQVDDISTAQRAQQLLVQGAKSPSISDLRTLATLNQQQPDAESQALLAGAFDKWPVGKDLRQSLMPVDKTGEGSSFRTATRATGK